MKCPTKNQLIVEFPYLKRGLSIKEMGETQTIYIKSRSFDVLMDVSRHIFKIMRQYESPTQFESYAHSYYVGMRPMKEWHLPIYIMEFGFDLRNENVLNEFYKYYLKYQGDEYGEFNES